MVPPYCDDYQWQRRRRSRGVRRNVTPLFLCATMMMMMMRVSTVVPAAAWTGRVVVPVVPSLQLQQRRRSIIIIRTPPSSSSSHHQHHSSRLYLKEQQKSSPYEYRPRAEMWPVTTHPDSCHRNVIDCFPRDLRAALLLPPPPKSRRIIRRTTLGLWVVAFVTVLQLGIRIATTHRFWAWTSLALALANGLYHGRTLLGQMWYQRTTTPTNNHIHNNHNNIPMERK